MFALSLTSTAEESGEKAVKSLILSFGVIMAVEACCESVPSTVEPHLPVMWER